MDLKNLLTKDLKEIILKYNNKIFSIIIIFLFMALLFTGFKKDETNILEFNENWTLLINDKLYSDKFSLKNDSFGILNIGDKIELINLIPSNELRNPSLDIYTNYTTLEVYVEDEKIYEYGIDNYKENKTVPDTPHWVSLSSNDNNKEIRLVLNVTENNTVSSISEIYLGNSTSLILNFLKDKMALILVSSFLILLGITFFIINLTQKDNVFSKKIYYLCLYCFLIGFWLLANENVLNLLINNSMIVKYIEYTTLYLIPLSVLGFIINVKNKENNEHIFNVKIMSTAYKIFFVYYLIALSSQILNILHLKPTLGPFQVLLIIAIVLIFLNIVVYLIKSKSKLKCDKRLSISLFIMLICIIFDIASYNLNLFNINLASFFIEHSIIIGVLILLAIMFVDFYESVLVNTKKAAQVEALNKLAFIDILTQLKNRTWYENYIKSLKNREYTIINFDLNSLKETNDTYGHEQGDVLIKEFADILKEVFIHNAHSVRFGGDEFVVILETIDNEEIKKNISNMNELILKRNKKNDFRVSVAYGYAKSNEIENSTPNKIYKLADNKMYENKKIMKMVD